MKHFFYAYRQHECQHGILNKLFENYPRKSPDEQLKILYDAADIIHDIRFEKTNEELNNIQNQFPDDSAENPLIEEIQGTTTAPNAADTFDKPDKEKKLYRINVLKRMWGYAEQCYQEFEVSSRGEIRKADEKYIGYHTSISRILYHLTRGNLCLRISQCYFQNYDLEQSEYWGDRAMEILWHGKQAATTLRDSEICQDKLLADLYLRLIKLNLAKYYRDYARKNRRSDFDAALDEFKWTRQRVEDQINNVQSSETKRQYALIWMDAVLNIVYIHRRKYQAEAAEKEMLFFYQCLKKQLQKNDSAFQRKDTKINSFPDLVRQADRLMSTYKDGEYLDLVKEDYPNLSENSFEICNTLDTYDRRRYFLLILLEFGRIFRALHFEKNYTRSVAIAIVADQWSYQMDRRSFSGTSSQNLYEPGHNLDALIIFSNSLRKYIKFGGMDEYKFENSLTIKFSEYTYEFQLRKDNEANSEEHAGLKAFVKKLEEFAELEHLRSKEEIIKWYCFYLQNPKTLHTLKDTVGKFDSIKKYFQEPELNHQLQFLKGLIYTRSGQYKEAVKIFEQLTSPKVKATQYIRFATIGLKARYLLATCYMALAEYSKAEKLLEFLKATLANAKESRAGQGMAESTDAEIDARIEVDLGYCYMQKSKYKKGIALYHTLYGNGGSSDQPQFNLLQVKKQRQIMGLNNYAACCILSIDDMPESKNNPCSDTQSSLMDPANWKPEQKIETARKIFLYLDSDISEIQKEGKDHQRNEDPETSLLKGYYTLCTGMEPNASPINAEELEAYRNTMNPGNRYMKNLAYVKAHKYFRKACRADEAFSARYTLMDEVGSSDRGEYRNEVERISVYLINLVKLNRMDIAEIKNFISKDSTIDKNNILTQSKMAYLNQSKRILESLLLNFPKAYQISLKAAITLAEWLLAQERDGHCSDTTIKQLYRSFSYLTIYEERGAKVFNNLKDNRNFRLFTADQRGKLLALLLSMYRPIKTIKEECCFTLTDMDSVPCLVHYTSMDTLKSILTAKESQFRINNCGYMNDVFEGTVFMRIIAPEDKENSSSEVSKLGFIEKYFPQLRRSHENRIPAGSNVYIGSLSVQKDSFHMWSVYAKKETGCNFEFGKDFFDIKGAHYYPKALRDYLISRYTDQDYPLYIVQYIEKEFGQREQETKDTTPEKPTPEKLNPENLEVFEGKGRKQTCGTKAIYYEALSPLLQQIYTRWKTLDDYVSQNTFALQDSRDSIYAFTADRINEIRFLFKDVNYEFEGEVRVVYTDSSNGQKAKTDASMKVPRVYVNLDRELTELTVRLGSRIEDATVDKYVTWLKHTKKVQKVELAQQNRYTV